VAKRVEVGKSTMTTPVYQEVDLIHLCLRFFIRLKRRPCLSGSGQILPQDLRPAVLIEHSHCG